MKQLSVFACLFLISGTMLVKAQDRIQFTCVFRDGNTVVAHYAGRSSAFVGLDGKPVQNWIGKVIVVYPAPFRDCSGEAGGNLRAVGETKLKIEYITYQSSNPTATNVRGTAQ